VSPLRSRREEPRADDAWRALETARAAVRETLLAGDGLATTSIRFRTKRSANSTSISGARSSVPRRAPQRQIARRRELMRA